MPEANSYLTCGSFMRPQCVSLFSMVIENYDIGDQQKGSKSHQTAIEAHDDTHSNVPSYNMAELSVSILSLKGKNVRAVCASQIVDFLVRFADPAEILIFMLAAEIKNCR
eukprot:SAG25_NODE_179_length_12643_cov_55.630660_4_plen_110_part_00